MRIVVVIEDGLVQGVYSDAPYDGELVIVDFDAQEFADEDDDRVRVVNGERAWIARSDPALDEDFVETVFAVW